MLITTLRFSTRVGVRTKAYYQSTAIALFRPAAALFASLDRSLNATNTAVRQRINIQLFSG